MEFNKKNFSNRLREIRLSKNLTQEELCAKIGIETPNYSNIETGKAVPTLQTLCKIMESLEISPNEVLEYNHFDDEKTIDEINLKIYNNFSIGQKRTVYKIFRALEEFKQ